MSDQYVPALRRLFLEGLIRLHKAGKLRSFGGPEAVLAYLSRHTHRMKVLPSGVHHIRHTRLPRERHTSRQDLKDQAVA